MLGGYKRYVVIGKVITIVLCLLFTTIPLSLSSEQQTNQQTISVSYAFNEPEITQITRGGTLYHQISMNDIDNEGNPGEPYLPSKVAYLLLPQGSTVISIQVACGEKILMGSTYDVEPVGPFIPTSQDSPPLAPQPNQDIYSSDDAFPPALYEEIGIQWFRGYEILLIDLHPVEYHPASQTLYYFNEITITVTLQQDQTSNPLYRGLLKDQQAVMKKIDNPSVLATYPVQPKQDRLEGISLLILTNDVMQRGLERLVTAHFSKGVTIFMTTVEQLGDHDPVTIRDYIKDAYSTFAIDYVLIAADHDIIPARFIYTGENIPSDMYYSCLDGSYNHDGDDKWGETNDGENGGDVDLLADVTIGRACVGNDTEVNHFVNKTIWYMNRNPSDPYLKEILLVGQYMCGPLEGNPLTFGDEYMEELIDGCNHNGYTTVGFPSSYYTFDRLYDGEWPGWIPENPWSTGWPKEELINRINNGVHIINHLGHSERFYNMKLDIGWDTDDVDHFTNEELCFIYSQGCTAGAFDRNASDPFPSHPYTIEDCIAEYFTVKREHAAFAGIWNAREGYYSPGSTNGPSQKFHRWFWDGVFGEGITSISDANQYSKEKLISSMHYGGVMRQIGFQLNYLGDPILTFLGIPANPLEADAHGPYTGMENELIQFQGSATGGCPEYTYSWDFGDGNTSLEQNPLKSYERDGTYTVTLTVHDSGTNITTDTASATIKNVLIANAHGPYEGVVNVPIQFTGSATGGFTPYTWHWEFGDGEESNEQNPTHPYTEREVFTVQLTVIDHSGHSSTNTTTTTIQQDSQPPSVKITTPAEGYCYFVNLIAFKRFFSDTPLIIGNVAFVIQASDEGSGMDKIDVYANDRFIGTCIPVPPDQPLFWTIPWTQRVFSEFHQTIRAVAYDTAGNNATDTIEVIRIL